MVAAALLSPLSFKEAFKGLVLAGLIAIAVVIVTNPYLFADWATFTHDLDRQRKFAAGDALLGQPERNGWWYYVTSSRWALGILPSLLAFAGGIALLVKGRRREAIVLGSLVVLYWLYMGSQSRFYARWMLPLYPALAILAAYALTLIRKQRRCSSARPCSSCIPTTYTTIRNAIVIGREDTRTETRDWLVANVPAGAKVVVRADRPDRVVRRDAGRRRQGRPAPPVGRASTAARRSSPSSRASTAARGATRGLPELRAHAHARR